MSERGPTQKELLIRIDERTCHMQKVLQDHLDGHRKARLAWIGALCSGAVALGTTLVQLLWRK